MERKDMMVKGDFLEKKTPKIVSGVQEGKDDQGRRIIIVTGTASTNDIDLDDEVIDQTKWRKESYDPKHVKFLPFHLYREFPIGKMWWIKPDPDKKSATKTRFRAQFGPTAFGLGFGELYLEELMDSFSVGFKAYDWIYPQDEDPKSKIWKMFIDHLLLEISAVNIPANLGARVDELKKALTESQESKDEIKAIVREYLEDGTLEETDSGIMVFKNSDKEREIIYLKDRIGELEQRLEKLEKPEIDQDDSIILDEDNIKLEGDTIKIEEDKITLEDKIAFMKGELV